MKISRTQLLGAAIISLLTLSLTTGIYAQSGRDGSKARYIRQGETRSKSHGNEVLRCTLTKNPDGSCRMHPDCLRMAHDKCCIDCKEGEINFNYDREDIASDKNCTSILVWCEGAKC